METGNNEIIYSTENTYAYHLYRMADISLELSSRKLYQPSFLESLKMNNNFSNKHKMKILKDLSFKPSCCMSIENFTGLTESSSKDSSIFSSNFHDYITTSRENLFNSIYEMKGKRDMRLAEVTIASVSKDTSLNFCVELEKELISFKNSLKHFFATSQVTCYSKVQIIWTITFRLENDSLVPCIKLGFLSHSNTYNEKLKSKVLDLLDLRNEVGKNKLEILNYDETYVDNLLIQLYDFANHFYVDSQTSKDLYLYFGSVANRNRFFLSGNCFTKLCKENEFLIDTIRRLSLPNIFRIGAFGQPLGDIE